MKDLTEFPKEKGTYFEVSDKKYPEIELPKWMKSKEDN